MEDAEKALIEIIEDVQETEKGLVELENELLAIPQFKKFLDLQRAVNEHAAKTWKNIEAQMIEHDIKQLKGDFGTVTLAERQNWEIDEELLPKKFFKKVVDTTKITATYRLENKAPAGCKPVTFKYLTKRLK